MIQAEWELKPTEAKKANDEDIAMLVNAALDRIRAISDFDDQSSEFKQYVIRSASDFADVAITICLFELADIPLDFELAVNMTTNIIWDVYGREEALGLKRHS